MSGVTGFIGLGQMGQRMARNLLTRGRRLAVYDIDAAKMREFETEGVICARNPAEVASVSAEVITMLPNSKHVETTFTDPETGILKALDKNRICIDCSTIDQATSIKLYKAVAERHASFVDAPVSGGILGAQNATLTFMVGGSADELVLLLMGKEAIHCGPVGSGQAVKACNNMLLAITMLGVVEAAHLGAKMGLDPKILMSVINKSSGRSWSTDTYNPVPGVIEGTPACRNYEGGFSCALMSKDLGLAKNAAASLGVPTPFGSMAYELYEMLSQSSEFQNKDFTVVHKFLEQQLGKPNIDKSP